MTRPPTDPETHGAALGRVVIGTGRRRADLGPELVAVTITVVVDAIATLVEYTLGDDLSDRESQAHLVIDHHRLSRPTGGSNLVEGLLHVPARKPDDMNRDRPGRVVEKSRSLSDLTAWTLVVAVREENNLIGTTARLGVVGDDPRRPVEEGRSEVVKRSRNGGPARAPKFLVAARAALGAETAGSASLRRHRLVGRGLRRRDHARLFAKRAVAGRWVVVAVVDPAQELVLIPRRKGNEDIGAVEARPYGRVVAVVGRADPASRVANIVPLVVTHEIVGHLMKSRHPEDDLAIGVDHRASAGL